MKSTSAIPTTWPFGAQCHHVIPFLASATIETESIVHSLGIDSLHSTHSSPSPLTPNRLFRLQPWLWAHFMRKVIVLVDCIRQLTPCFSSTLLFSTYRCCIALNISSSLCRYLTLKFPHPVYSWSSSSTTAHHHPIHSIASACQPTTLPTRFIGQTSR